MKKVRGIIEFLLSVNCSEELQQLECFEQEDTKQEDNRLLHSPKMIIIQNKNDEGNDMKDDKRNDIEKGSETVVKGVKENSIRYAPENYKMWDPWFITKGDEIHLIHLKGLRKEFSYNMEEENTRGYGHAVSKDLLHWNEKEDILKVDTGKNYLDCEYRYTGSTIEHQGKYYTFYTMRKGQGQRIGVAYSGDLNTWTEFEGNPVLVPDEQWFITYANDNVSNHPRWGAVVDCRDLVVIRDEEGDGFWGYFVAAADRGETTPKTVIGLAYSKDLLKWEQRGIAYEPEGVTMPEMIDVFRVNDKWFMTLTTAKNNGGINSFSDPYITRAQIYASAASPEDRFLENEKDNVLMGGQINSGYSSRTIDFNGKKRIMYVDSNGGDSVISLPKNIEVNDEGKLRMHYAEDILKTLRVENLKADIAIHPTNSFAWNTAGGKWEEKDGTYSCTTDIKSWQAFLMKGIASNLELAFTVCQGSTCSSYGLVISGRGGGKLLNDLDYILVIDKDGNKIYLTNAEWDMKNCRKYMFNEKRVYNFCMLLVGNTIELYIDNEMVFNSGITNNGMNRTGLFANDGSIRVDNVKLYGLEND